MALVKLLSHQLVSCDHRVRLCWRSRKLPSKHLTGHSPLQRQQLGTVRTATTTPQSTRLLKTHLSTLGWSRTVVPPAPLTHYLLMNYGAVIQINDRSMDRLIDRLIDWLIDCLIDRPRTYVHLASQTWHVDVSRLSLSSSAARRFLDWGLHSLSAFWCYAVLMMMMMMMMMLFRASRSPDA